MALACAVWGTAPWITWAAGFGAYPGSQHPERMIGGFLFLCVAGFLMTAVPRFTGTAAATRLETGAILAVAGLLALVETELIPGGSGASAHVAIAAGLLLLTVFVARRLVHRRSVPPPFIVFVCASLVAGLVGAVLIAVARVSGSHMLFLTLGRALLIDSLMQGLVLGVGLRVVPSILGTVDTGTWPAASAWSYRRVAVLAALYFQAIIIEALGAVAIGRSVRTAVVAVVVLGTWRVHRASARPGVQSVGLRLAAISFLIGTAAPLVAPGWGLNGAHLVFIGGLGVTTMLVATRVTLSHGGVALDAERHSKALAVFTTLALLAMVMRAVAPLAEAGYAHALAVAAALWILAILVWGARFGRTLLGVEAAPPIVRPAPKFTVIGQGQASRSVEDARENGAAPRTLH